jgi:hypothetical protein
MDQKKGVAMDTRELAGLTPIERLSRLGPRVYGLMIVGLIAALASLYYAYHEAERQRTLGALSQRALIERVENYQRGVEDIQSALKKIDTGPLKVSDVAQLIYARKKADDLLQESRDWKLNWSRPAGGANLDFISSAYADTPNLAPTAGGVLVNRSMILWVVLGLLACVYLGALYSVFFAQRERNIAVSTDLVKTLTGFFIGVVSTMVGP